MTLSELSSVVSKPRDHRPAQAPMPPSAPRWAERGGQVALQQVAELLSGPIRRPPIGRPQAVLCLTREMRRLDHALAILESSHRA